MAEKKLSYERYEEWDPVKLEELSHHYREILRLIGENPEREGLLKTPFRVAKAIQFLTQGYNMDPIEVLASAKFREDYREMVIVKDIEIYSMCEHHMIPFIGKAHVAYIPGAGKIAGIGELAKAVEILAKRPQVQERLTAQLADMIMDKLKRMLITPLSDMVERQGKRSVN